MSVYHDYECGDYDPDFDREVMEQVRARHDEEDRIEAERCEADPYYAEEAPLRAIGA